MDESLRQCNFHFHNIVLCPLWKENTKKNYLPFSINNQAG